MIRNKVLLSVVAGLVISMLVFAADITGTWTASFDTQIGVQNYTLTFKEIGRAHV